MAFREQTWQIECGTWWKGYTPCDEPICSPSPTGWTSFGVIKLVFHRDYTISVYKDGQYLYNVRVDICRGFACVGAPTQRLFIPVSWGPDGIAIGVAQFRYNRHSVGYGEGIHRVRDMQTVALPFYYRYNLTGAYPYRLDVQINTAEKEITQVGSYVYINVTYSGYLKLYLGDQLVAYDALYGWTIRREQAPPPVNYEPERPEPRCVPQVVRKRKGLVHRNLQQGQDGYSVEVLRRFEVREFGCGVDRTYEEVISAGVYTATGTSYHVKDPKNRVCGFRQARNCRGVVYCDRCPSPNQQSE
ncbi:MAG: hypothetical protein ACO2PN_14495 [Pyrobaculum sp.]